MIMQWVLFSVFISIFIATAVITLLGLIQKVNIKEGFLKGLYVALILEVIGVLISLGQSQNFFGNPLNDFLIKLPPQVQSESIDETIEKIERLTQRPLECNNCDEKVSLLLSELPNDFQRATPESTIQIVNERLKHFNLKTVALDAFFSSLPIEVQSTNHDEIKNKIDLIVNNHSNLSSHVATISSKLETCQNKKNACGVKENGLFSKLIILHSDVQRFGNINFQWRANEKKEIAFRVLEVMGELGYYTGTAELNPLEAHKTVVLYQKDRQIQPANGRFGRQTLLQLFNDFLHLE